MRINVKAKVRMKSAGAKVVLTSPRVRADLVSRAERIEAAAGPGHFVDSQPGPNRARAAVVTRTEEAKRAEAEDRNLSRALDAGR